MGRRRGSKAGWGALREWAQAANPEYWQPLVTRLEAMPVGQEFRTRDLVAGRLQTVQALLLRAIAAEVVEVLRTESIGRARERVYRRR